MDLSRGEKLYNEVVIKFNDLFRRHEALKAENETLKAELATQKRLYRELKE